MLVIKNINKKFEDRIVLDNVCLQIARGEIVLFLGRSGVGKSTLLRVLNQLEHADSGTVLYDELPLVQEGKSRTVGMVFQHFNLFQNYSVVDNITIVLEKVVGMDSLNAARSAHQLLAQYGLLEFKNAPVSTLSGGQKQRLAIARAVCLSPAVICMDEPTSGLDPRSTNMVVDHLHSLSASGYIVLVASHDIGLIDKLQHGRICLMASGKIVEDISLSKFRQDSSSSSLLDAFIRGALE